MAEQTFTPAELMGLIAEYRAKHGTSMSTDHGMPFDMLVDILPTLYAVYEDFSIECVNGEVTVTIRK